MSNDSKRFKFSAAHYCFLTSRAEDYAQIAGFEAGADDYITKPIRPRLLITKIESLLRRFENTKRIDVDTPSKKIKIDREKFLIEVDGLSIILPKKNLNF